MQPQDARAQLRSQIKVYTLRTLTTDMLIRTELERRFDQTKSTKTKEDNKGLLKATKRAMTYYTAGNVGDHLARTESRWSLLHAWT